MPNKSVKEFRSFSMTLEKLRKNTLRTRDAYTLKRFLSGKQDAEDMTGGEESESEPKDESNVLFHKKGHPLYLIKPEDLIPKFWYLENFVSDDYCFFKPDVLEEKLKLKEWNDDAIKLCTVLIHDTIAFCFDKKFTNRMGVAAMEILYQAFDFLMWNMSVSLEDLHNYFRQMILLYAVDDIPASMAIFTPSESFLVATYFAGQFDSVFLLLKTVAFPNYEIRIPVEDS